MSDRARGRPLRLAVLVRSLGHFRGGVDVYVRELTAALIELAGDAHQLVHVVTDDAAIAAEFDVEDATVTTVRPGLFGRLGWDHWQAPLACARAGDDVVVSLRSFRPLFVAGRSVSVVYDMSYHDIPSQLPWWDGAYFRTLHRLSLRRSDRIVVFSRFTRDRIVANLPSIRAEQIDVLTPGPPDAAFRPIDDARIRATLAHFGLAQPYVLAVGAQPRKNIDTVIEAIAKLGAGDPMRLVLVSAWNDAAHVRSLRERAERCGLGARFSVLPDCSKQHLAALYCGATALAYVSSYEGIGIPPLEAMAAGCAVIAADAASIPEVVGAAAELVPARDVDALSAAIRRVRDDATFAAGLRERGFEHIRDFAWRRTAQELLASVAMIASPGHP